MWLPCLIFVIAVAVGQSQELTIIPDYAILEIGQDGQSLMVLNTTEIHSANDAQVWTVESTSQHKNMAHVKTRQSLTFNVSNGCLYAQLEIYSGRLIGENVITLNSTVNFTDGDVAQVSVEYVTQMVTNKSHTKNYTILSYLFYPVLLALLFTSCVDINLSELRSLVAWICGTSLIQAVLIPLIVAILVMLIGVKTGSKLGVITVAFSPGVLLSLPFGILFDANLTLLISLVFASTVFAFIVMPLWTLQYTSAVPSLSPGDVPYLALLLHLALMLVVAAAALISRHRNLSFISSVRQINYPLSAVAILFWFFVEIYGASDIILSVDTATGAAASVPSVLLGIIILTSVLSTGRDTDKWKACAVFLLLKDNALSHYTLTKALSIAGRSTSLVGVYFYSFMSFLVAFLVLIVYRLVKYLYSKNLLKLPVQSDSIENSADRNYGGYNVVTNEQAEGSEDSAVAETPRQPLQISASPNLFIWT